jgi:hypothetical protein
VRGDFKEEDAFLHYYKISPDPSLPKRGIKEANRPYRVFNYRMDC